MTSRILPILVCCFALLSGCQRTEYDSPVVYDSVEAMTSEAGMALERGDYEASLLIYAEALKQNPVDMNVLLGMAKCQIALGNYATAAFNLSAAAQVNPQAEEIYELYVELSQASGTISYARTAVALAKTNRIEAFLSRVPQAPAVSCEDGNYDHRLEVEITSDANTEVCVVEKKDNSSQISYKYTGNPLLITRGKTNLEIYCVKDGIPSETVMRQYICEYEPIEITFADPVIEKIVRNELGRPDGGITDVECEGITALRQSNLRNAGMEWMEYENLRIRTLEDLQWFPNLTQLYLEYLYLISDYTPLAQCKKLATLEITDSKLDDVSFVQSIPALKFLFVDNNEISDVTPLRDCKNLTSLYITGNPVHDFTVLKDLKLTALEFDIEQMQDLSILLNWMDMSSLYIHGCGGYDLSILGQMTGLERLSLYAENSSSGNRKPIGDLNFLTSLVKLERLYLYGLADYSHVESVKQLSNLTYLYMRTLGYTAPSDELIRELQQSLPNCEIR